MVDSTGDWNEAVGCLLGWRPPDKIDATWREAIKVNIARLDAALAPMTRFEPTKMALVRLSAVTATAAGDKLTHEMWLEVMLEHVREFPEGVVLEALREAEKRHKFRPAPAELLKLIRDEVAGPRDELQRLKQLLALMDQPAIAHAPMTEDERAKMRGNLARFSNWTSLVVRSGKHPWDGPWPKPVDLMSDDAYARFLALPNVQAALTPWTPPAPPIREPAPEISPAAAQ